MVAPSLTKPDTRIATLLTRTGNLLDDIGVIEHHWHSRWRVYPQDITVTATLTAVAVANTFGNWAQILPINTVPFDFDIVGLILETVSASTRYHVQLGCSPDATEPGTNEELGERRFPIATVPAARATELLDVRGQECLANYSVWGRVKTASGAADNCTVSLVLVRHVEVTREEPNYPAFPW